MYQPDGSFHIFPHCLIFSHRETSLIAVGTGVFASYSEQFFSIHLLLAADCHLVLTNQSGFCLFFENQTDYGATLLPT